LGVISVVLSSPIPPALVGRRVTCGAGSVSGEAVKSA
jgi:hypothetical protein